MTVGRKPTPTADKVARGNPGKRPVNQREPKPQAGLPRCPSHVTGEARREWHRMGKQLEKEGRIALVYRACFAAYCVAYGRWAEAEQRIQDEGLIIKTGSGHLQQTPYLAISNRAEAQMMKAIAELGLSPSSQSRVSTVKLPAEVTKLKAFLGGKAG